MRAIAQKLERTSTRLEPGTRPFVVAAIVVGWLALGLALDDGGGIGRQRLIGAATWLLLIVLVRREPRVDADPGRDARRARDAARVLGLAAARPLHLPPAQRAGVRAARATASSTSPRCSSGRRPPSRGGRWSRCWCWRSRPPGPSAAWSCPFSPDTLGAVLFVSFAAFILRGRYPGVYAAAFVLTAALELYGTRLGTWALGAARSDRPAERRQPAERHPGRVLLARLLGARAGAVRLRAARARAAPAAQTCSSGAIVSPKPPS